MKLAARLRGVGVVGLSGVRLGELGWCDVLSSVWFSWGAGLGWLGLGSARVELGSAG